jgi:hypothetical protein
MDCILDLSSVSAVDRRDIVCDIQLGIPRGAWMSDRVPIMYVSLAQLDDECG